MAASVGVKQELIVRAALTLLDEVGLEGLTMRRLATALKIQAPSLYWHFPNKQALLDGMADAIFGAVSLPRKLKSKAWDERLKAVIRAIRRSLQPRLLRAGFRDGGTGTGSANRRPARSREPTSQVREPCRNEVPKHPRGIAPHVRQRSRRSLRSGTRPADQRAKGPDRYTVVVRFSRTCRLPFEARQNDTTWLTRQ